MLVLYVHKNVFYILHFFLILSFMIKNMPDIDTNILNQLCAQERIIGFIAFFYLMKKYYFFMLSNDTYII